MGRVRQLLAVGAVLVAGCGGGAPPEIATVTGEPEPAPFDEAATTTTSAAPPQETTTTTAARALTTTTTTRTTTTTLPRLAGNWTDVPAAPGRATGAGVWTGREIVVWGDSGSTTFDEAPVGALAYDPATRAWRELPAGPLPNLFRPAAAWTGKQVVYWGAVGRQDPKAAGAALDPATGAWRGIADPPGPVRMGTEHVWTGTELLLFGGYTGCCPVDSTIHGSTVTAYDPTTDRWRSLADMPAPFSGDGGNLVVRAVDGDVYAWRHGHVGRLDVQANAWEDLGSPPTKAPNTTGVCGMSTSGGPLSYAGTAGGELLGWTSGCPTEGWGRRVTDGQPWQPLTPWPAGTGVTLSLVDGGRWLLSAGVTFGGPNPDPAIHAYEVRTDRWAHAAAPPTVGLQAQATWIGDALFVWGGRSPDGTKAMRSGAIFHPTG